MADINSPITLVGIGRSGTTLLEKAFQASENTYAGGETAGIIFGTYAGALDSFFNSEKTNFPDRDDFASSVVRNLFDDLFPINDKKFDHWFHKPAGIPKMIPWSRFRTNHDRFDFPTQWYWNTLDNVFPSARYITVLRNPWEIILSRMVFSGWPESGGWTDIRSIYDIISSRLDSIDVIFFDDLVEKPFDEISILFDRLDIQIPINLREIVAKKYVPTDKNKISELRHSMQGPNFDSEVKELIASVWRRFNKEFKSPDDKFQFFD